MLLSFKDVASSFALIVNCRTFSRPTDYYNKSKNLNSFSMQVLLSIFDVSKILLSYQKNPINCLYVLCIGPPTRWSAARKSPELRIYRSLPSRHQEYREIISKNEIVKSVDRETWNSDEKEAVAKDANEQFDESNSSTIGDPCKDAITKNESISLEKLTSRVETNERTNAKRIEKLSNKQDEEVLSSNAIKTKKNDRSAATTSCNKTKVEEPDETTGSQEQNIPRISLIKPPRILSKFISPEIKSPIKHGDRKSNIPIFKRSCKEFEDIRSPQESSKRSLIPQRYLFNHGFNQGFVYIARFMYHLISKDVYSFEESFRIKQKFRYTPIRFIEIFLKSTLIFSDFQSSPRYYLCDSS